MNTPQSCHGGRWREISSALAAGAVTSREIADLLGVDIHLVNSNLYLMREAGHVTRTDRVIRSDSNRRPCRVWARA